jgi:hypothetical protein
MGNFPFTAAGLTLAAATPVTGYTLLNGTGTILSAAVPADGNLHHVAIFAVLCVSAADTGGQIALNVTNPDGVQRTFTLMANSLASGANPGASLNQLWPVAPGSTVLIEQFQPLTVGAAVFYGSIWLK